MTQVVNISTWRYAAAARTLPGQVVKSGHDARHLALVVSNDDRGAALTLVRGSLLAQTFVWVYEPARRAA